MPHDAESLYYKLWFKAKHGRWSCWSDALAHCSPEMRAAWEQELRERGIWSEPVTTKEEEVLAQIEGKPIIKLLPPGAPIPPLVKVETIRIGRRRRRGKKL